jgi:nitronate monooxygenase
LKRRDVRSLLRLPIVVAPIGGGPSTTELVVAAARSRAFGFLAGANKTVDAMQAEIDAVRAATTEAFRVNLFVPGRPTTQPAETGTCLASLDGDAIQLGAALGDPRWGEDGWDAKIEALLDNPPPLVSFAFGCPERRIVEAFHDAGALVAVTVTGSKEAGLAESRGADCLCLQGIEAGAHRGCFTNDGPIGRGVGVRDLISQVARVTAMPLIAAGGIGRADDVSAVLRAGAVAAQCGTAFLRCPESGANRAYKEALADPWFTTTPFTRSFSGRPARSLINQFVLDHPDAPPAYPEINNATRPMRAAAARVEDIHRMSLWAGTGFKQATAHPAAEVIEHLYPKHNEASKRRVPYQ